MADSFELEVAALAEKFGAMSEDINKVVKKATVRGAYVALPIIKSRAPMRSGQLRSGIVVNEERTLKVGLQWHDVMMDAMKNSIFQKPIQNPDRSTSDAAYYPASMEYGYFRRRSGGGLEMVPPAGQKPARVPGRYFMRGGADEADNAVKSAIVDTLLTEIEKEWKKWGISG